MGLVTLLVVVCIFFMLLNAGTALNKWWGAPEGTGFWTWVLDKQGVSKDTGVVVDYVVSVLGGVFFLAMFGLVKHSLFDTLPKATVSNTES